MATGKLTNEQIELVMEVVQAIGGTIINIKRYPPGSAIVQMALDRGVKAFEALFTQCETFTVGENERQILVNDEPLAEKIQGRAYVTKFMQTLLERKIRSLTFNRGLETEELVRFIEVLGQNPEDFKRGGKVSDMLAARNVTHVGVDEKVFVALKKDQVVADIAALEHMRADGSASADQLKDSTFVKYFLSKLQQSEMGMSEDKLNELKKQIDYDKLQNAKTIDFARLGPVLAAALEKMGQEEAADTVVTPVAAAPGISAGLAGTLSPDLVSILIAQQEAMQRDEADNVRQQRVEKLSRTFESISEVILSFDQADIRDKLVGDLMKIILNFKTSTLTQMLATPLAADEARDQDFKRRILSTISAQKTSAVVDGYLKKFHGMLEGFSPADFEVNENFLANSASALEQLVQMARDRKVAPDVAEKATRALKLARSLEQEAPDPAKLLVLKVRRLLARDPSFFLDERVQTYMPDLLLRLLDLKRPDVARRLLDRFFQNAEHPDPDMRLKVPGALVRVSQAMLDLKNQTLHPTLHAMLLRGFKQETDQRVYAGYLAALVADIGRMVHESNFPLVIQVLKSLGTLQRGESDENKRRFVDMARGKITEHEELLEHLMAQFAADDEKQSELALQVLNSVDPHRVVPLLFDLLADSDEMRVRKKAMVALTRNPELAADEIRARLGGQDLPWFLLRNLIMLAGDLKIDDTDSLIAPHLKHERPQVRQAALSTLAKLATPAAEQYLANALPGLDETGQKMVVSHFGVTRSKAALDYMIDQLDPATPNRAENLVPEFLLALGRIGDPKALAPIKKIVRTGGFGFFKNKPDEKVIIAALRALADIGGDEAKAIAGKFTRDSNPAIARVAQQVMKKA